MQSRLLVEGWAEKPTVQRLNVSDNVPRLPSKLRQDPQLNIVPVKSNPSQKQRDCDPCSILILPPQD